MHPPPKPWPPFYLDPDAGGNKALPFQKEVTNLYTMDASALMLDRLWDRLVYMCQKWIGKMVLLTLVSVLPDPLLALYLLLLFGT